MVRMQKVGIKYKKPIVFLRCAQGAFQRRIIDCDDVVAGMGRGAVKLWRIRGRTGGLGTDFFTQNSGNIFFRAATSRNERRRDRSEKVSQINGAVF
jgi:hypothetical protein